ncbi:hypothetical protein COV05_00625 [Candidatus Uhrbacteria bacterium CG10_big_fil_rev_8_21_14_0_10_48_16]|uniref:Type II secretion system protein n=1 Tax=Candidatus Uhrbacteria bacterium CG10_big_fil_rev_8_21_14_0_10_48_16 TaxID=1975038 RepID=A0A2M8LI27_9BACT|nr:MAG: hypothetical protein COV05_00625 [Candidatus Uhrbacteria bacterium CG10_big_fil_rev_8_21_14_0_10_48_16]
MKTNNSKKGFTLIELVLYVGIASGILLVSTLFLQTLLESRVKNQTIAEVEQQGLQVMHLIAQTVRNAENITSPTIGGSAGSLTLDVVNIVDDPTVFYVSGDSIQMTEGAGSTIALTNSHVAASALTFQNLSRPDTPGIVRVSFILTHVNSSGRQEYEFSKTFYASASLRHP